MASGILGRNISHALGIVFRYHPLGIEVYRQETDALSSHFAYRVRLEHRVERSAGKVIIEAKQLCVGYGKIVGQTLQAIVKLMIAKDTDVIAKGIHKFFFKLALIYGKEKRTLHRVAGVDQNHIFLFGADTVDKHLSARHSAHAVGPRVDLRVGIVGGKNRQSLSRRRGCEHHGCRGSEVFYCIVHINQITN